MNRSIVLCAVLLSAATLVAQEEEDLDDVLAKLPAVQTNAVPVKLFTTLPLCQRVEGTASVKRPGHDWEPAEEGRFYPFGTSYRAGRNSRLAISFGPTSFATVKDGASFGTRPQGVDEKSRGIVLEEGLVDLRLPNNMPDGKFHVSAPGFTVKDMHGESKLTRVDKGDGDEVTVRCVTGRLFIEGRHFDILSMEAADEVKIRTSRDQLSTILFGTSGDYVVKLDQGLDIRSEITDQGELTNIIEAATFEWHLTTYRKIVINRAVPALGERLSVHTMAFDADGERKSERHFCEGRAEVNSGELVPKPKSSKDDLAKRAAEVTEAAEATETEEVADEPAEEGSSSGESDYEDE